MNSNAIVTLADSNYFELLQELIGSIKSHKENNDISYPVIITVCVSKIMIFRFVFWMQG